jgi:hypothetical protein
LVCEVEEVTVAKKKPKLSKEERDRAEEIAACNELAKSLKALVGFDVHVEAVNGYVYKRGGAISLASVKQIVERLAKPARAKTRRRRKTAAQRELFTEGK